MSSSGEVKQKDGPTPLPTFGRLMRNGEFLLDPSSIHINHGSWGSAPKRVFEARVRWLKQIECQPDTFFRRAFKDAWFENLYSVCEYLGLNPSNVAFVENATSGINSALKGLPLKAGDQIMTYSWTYSAIQKTCLRMAELSGAEVVTLDLTYPVDSKETVVNQYKSFLDDHPKVKVAIIEYIASPTATILPARRLIEECKNRDIITILDGAHTPGQIKLDIEDMDPDFYIGTLHKWFFVPRGCALLRVAQRFQESTRPVVTSHCYNQKPWQMDFFYQATRDSTTYMVVKDAVKFYEDLGGLEAIAAYVEPLLEAAVAHLVDVWGTYKFQIPRDMEAPFMKLVRLPDIPRYQLGQGVYYDMDQLMRDLYERFNVHCTALMIHDQPWLRIAGNVYNSLDEYKKVGQYILTLKNEVMK